MKLWNIGKDLYVKRSWLLCSSDWMSSEAHWKIPLLVRLIAGASYCIITYLAGQLLLYYFNQRVGQYTKIVQFSMLKWLYLRIWPLNIYTYHQFTLTYHHWPHFIFYLNLIVSSEKVAIKRSPSLPLPLMLPPSFPPNLSSCHSQTIC